MLICRLILGTALCLATWQPAVGQSIPASGGEGDRTAAKALETQVTRDEIVKAVKLSLPVIQAEGRQWIEQKNCVSCHQVNSMIWSLQLADDHGLLPDDDWQQWRDWATESVLSINDEGKVAGLSNKEGVAQLVLGLVGQSDLGQQRNQLVSLLSADQQDDGSWAAGGQLPSQKRPPAETNLVSTIWITLALLQQQKLAPEVERDVEFNVIIDKAKVKISESQSGTSTEWYAARLLLAAETGDDEELKKWGEQLLSHQQKDGGWGWLVQNPSDALATGMALYALSKTGNDLESDTVQKAQRFLLKTQQENGKWPVFGTKAKKSGSVQRTATYWGTCWAVIGLLTSVPEK